MKMRTLLGIILTGYALAAHAQPLAIDWFNWDGVGGFSTGNGYALVSNLGQPEAGTLSQGAYTLQGGFWPALVQPPSEEGPLLSIKLAGNQVILSWPPPLAGFILESTEDLRTAVWTPVSAVSPVGLPRGARTQFFRLKKN